MVPEPDRGAIGPDQPRPVDQNSILPRPDVGLIFADQARATRHQHPLPVEPARVARDDGARQPRARRIDRGFEHRRDERADRDLGAGVEHQRGFAARRPAALRIAERAFGRWLAIDLGRHRRRFLIAFPDRRRRWRGGRCHDSNRRRCERPCRDHRDILRPGNCFAGDAERRRRGVGHERRIVA